MKEFTEYLYAERKEALKERQTVRLSDSCKGKLQACTEVYESAPKESPCQQVTSGYNYNKCLINSGCPKLVARRQVILEKLQREKESACNCDHKVDRCQTALNNIKNETACR
ncbi:hypothetical protein ElyMa_002498000 [Elysia marginata]|uniref:GDNF/GAS1 domain-containing protein n=1 Tax=Elysia marginata TaxID=1093978 RepID=A0AAV4GRE2_9GAST|nr:hypothetical protein ElyMa_002498000 [Elysia marginata]